MDVDVQLDSLGRERHQFQTHNDEPSLTVQSDGPAADIQEILKSIGAGGLVTNLDRAEGMFLDISEFTDYADAFAHAKQAEIEFMKLPSKHREVFHHDVAEWLDTAHDPEKRDALVAAGIIDAPEGSREEVMAEVRPKTDVQPGPDLQGDAGTEGK